MKFLPWICAASLTASAFAGTESRNERIVDFGSDLGSGEIPYRGKPPEKKIPYEKTMGGDSRHEAGRTFVSAWPLSFDEPLNAPGIRYDTTQKSAVFYGGLITLTINNPERGLSEGHLNANHAFRDDVNFMALQGGAFKPGEEIEAYALWFWKKKDFLNGGDSQPVSFNDKSLMAVHVSRYWGGVHAGRWVVRDGETFYVSEKTFGDQYKQFTFQDKDNPIVHHTHILSPNATRWAKWEPKPPYAFSFDHRTADFQAHRFTDVAAVGFLVTRELTPAVKAVPGGLSPNQPIAVKWYAFRCDAVVGNGDMPSTHVPMVDVASAGLSAGRSEISFFQWEQIRRIAVTNQYGRDLGDLGYCFQGDGSMGAMRVGDKAHSPGEPVTDVTWLDALAWCNALSEVEGKEPAYYTDPEKKAVLRRTFDRDKVENKPMQVFWKQDATGYRLPTETEWKALALAGGKGFGDNPAWTAANSGGTTQSTLAQKPGPQGLCGLNGNVWEYVWPSQEAKVDPATLPVALALGGDFATEAGRQSLNLGFGKEKPFEQGSYGIGFRVVSGSWKATFSTPGEVPIWRIERGMVMEPGATGDVAGIREYANKHLMMIRVPGAGLADERDFVDPLSIQERNTTRAKALDDKFLERPGAGDTAPEQAGDKPRSPRELYLARTEIPYGLWNRVRAWSASRGYHFNYPGDIGSMRMERQADMEFGPDQPVTYISWYDAVAWSNALSELMNASPVYFTDSEKKGVFRLVSPFRLETYAGAGYPNPVWKKNRRAGEETDTALSTLIFFDPSRDGYRLPLYDEFRAAAGAGVPGKSGLEWTGANSEGRTHPVGTTGASSGGLFDMGGNVLEWGWDPSASHINSMVDYRVNGDGYFFELPTPPKGNKAYFREYTGAARSFIGLRVARDKGN